ncbi:MAG: PilX N-terminal domain-containing pilus assembly protein [Nitrospiraceae bacterium]
MNTELLKPERELKKNHLSPVTRHGPARRSALAREGASPTGEEGLALLTVVLLLMIMTVLGIAAITTTSLENRMAGFTRTGEAAAGSAESCVGTAVNIIQQTIDAGALPAAFLDNAVPAGPVPQANGPTLQQEIMGQSDNNPDAVNSVPPNTVAQVNTYVVNGDIDRLYAAPKAGSAMQFAAGYEGTAAGAAGGGIDIIYRIDCAATNVATGASSRITAVYACLATGESCQKKI